MPISGSEVIFTVKQNFKKPAGSVSFLLFKEKIYCRKGTVLIMFSLLLPLIMILAGMVLDLGRAFVYKAELNKACMAAAEEATKEIDMTAAQQQGSNCLNGIYCEIINDFFYANITQKQKFTIDSLHYEVFGADSNPRYIKVICNAEVDCFFLQLAGIPKINIHSSGCGRLKRLSEF